MLVNLQRLDTHGKPRPWLFVGNRITRCLVCCMVMSLAAAAQESHDFNRGRCQIENKTDKEIMLAFRSGGSINGFECFPETDTMGIDAHTNTYVDIYYYDYLDTYEANGKDPISITEMVMPIVINNFNTRDIYVDETFTINPQTNSVTTSK